MTNLDGEILSQLSSIQRSLGETIGMVNAIREEVRTQGIDATAYRKNVKGDLENVLQRMGKAEIEIKALKQTVDQTVKPMIAEGEAAKNKIAGFLLAFSLIGTGVGGIVWFVTGGGLELIIKSLTKLP